MNRIINEYGASQATEVGKRVAYAVDEFERSIRRIVTEYNLTPVEIRCVESICKPTVFAEEILRAAMKMKREQGPRCWLKIPYIHSSSTVDKVEKILAAYHIPFKRCDGRTWECYRTKDWVEKMIAGKDIDNTYQIHD